MLGITEDMTVGELLDKSGMTLDELEDMCKSRLDDGVIDTEGETVEETEFKPEYGGEDVIDTFGLGIIPGGKSASSRLSQVAKGFLRKLGDK